MYRKILFLKLFTAAFIVLIVGIIVVAIDKNKEQSSIPGAESPTKDTIIRKENQSPGTEKWESNELENYRPTEEEERIIEDANDIQSLNKKIDLVKDANAVADGVGKWYNNKPIYGYPSVTSINHGESIGLKVSTTRPSFKIEVYRMGWYGGTGAKLITSIPSMPGKVQPIRPMVDTGLVTLDWETSHELQTTTDWVSGVYMAKLITSNNESSYIIFVVRNDETPADILFQIPFATYQAYNNWGGKSLYAYNSSNGQIAYQVSFKRPYSMAAGAGLFFDGDYHMVRWLEKEGYNVSYASSTDLQNNPNLLNNKKVFLTNWHDEYYSKTMRDNLTKARDRGVDLAFIGANNMYYQIRYENDRFTNEKNTTIICYRSASRDPIYATNPRLTTLRWRDPIVNNPENRLLGVIFQGAVTWGSAYPMVVTNATHWAYEGTGLNNGDKVNDVIGYEYDTYISEGAPANLTILSNSPLPNGRKTNSTIYRADSGALVFASGAVNWAWKLDHNGNEYDASRASDPRIQRMTANILNRMISKQPTVTQPPTPTPKPTVPPTNTPTPVASPTPADPNTYSVFDDALNAGWEDWSWSSANNLADTTKPATGIRNISWKQNAGFAGLYLHSNTPIEIAPFNSFNFSIQTTQAGAKLGVQFYDQNNQAIGTMLSLSEFGGDPTPNVYKNYEIPVSALAGASTSIGGFHIMDLTGTAQPVIYIDRVRLTNNATPTVTPTPQPTSGINIFTDVLATGWESWSWDTQANFANTTPVNAGTSSISYVSTAGFSGLDLHNSAGVNLAGLTTLRFVARSTNPGQSYAVYLDDEAGAHLSPPVPISRYGGDPVNTSWKIYNIPLADLNATGKVIKDVVFHEILGQPQPALYLDDISIR